MLRRGGLLVALTALLVPAVAGTPAQAKTRAPVVTRITPKHVYVGETLTIRGHHFRRGLNKNTVAFKRTGAKVVLVKAQQGTTKMLRVTLPKRLEKVLVVKNGTPTATTLRVRVLASKFGKRFTSRAKSPVVGPEKPPAPPKPPTVDPNADCDGDGTPNRLDTDDDNDLLSDTLEKSLRLDECNSDSDGDGVEDGYEYQSAKDLNDDEHQNPNAYLPYPAKMPYPNPLDKTDAATDHDGDSLTLMQEYRLWKYSIAHSGEPRTLERLSYSAGEQYSKSARAGGSGVRTPTLLASNYTKHNQFVGWIAAHNYSTVGLADIGTDLWDPQAEWYEPRTAYNFFDANRNGAVSGAEQLYYDDGDGYLNDGERDEDGDGLTNFDETRGCMNSELWRLLYGDEKPFPVLYAGTDLDDADTDGDGIVDGADDQDHDDVPNVMECSRARAAGTGMDLRTATTARANLPASGFVNPFNPCEPHFLSRTCPRWIDVGQSAYAPFDQSKRDNGKYYFIWN
jgi:hypothetical protein